MRFRPGDSLGVDQRTGFKTLHSDLREEPVTGLLVRDPDPEHPSLRIPDTLIGVEVVDCPTGPQQDQFISAYGFVFGVAGNVSPPPPSLPYDNVGAIDLGTGDALNTTV